ncbi:TPA: hypothetical protein QC443_002567 [Bacillus cereus]|nr:hypothetical protein [Bacillus cereus]HDR8076518.1 hypothetical protein [Bacillus cereus]HDR8514867.1 hypothetical protein [Bacillus cereus]
MASPEELIGEKIGLLTVISLARQRINNKNLIFYYCLCECGKETNVRRSDLIRKDSRRVRSCGCFSVNKFRNMTRSHGMSQTRFYRIWANIRKRIYDPNSISYKNYGGRGIKMCDEWHTFENFMADMYESYEKHVKEHGEKETTLERKDSNGNYEKRNCTWATSFEQKNNQRRHKRFEATNLKTGEKLYASSKSIFAREHGICRQHINKVLNGERKSTGGFSFKYVE